MSKRKPSTPRSKVRAALRQLWLRSRERAAACKAESYTCEECNVIDEVFRVLLVHPDRLQVLCKACHEKIHGGKND
jgi:hypothetical protein